MIELITLAGYSEFMQPRRPQRYSLETLHGLDGHTGDKFPRESIYPEEWTAETQRSAK